MALIEREALLEIVEQQGHVTVDDILSADTIDAAPVVYGKWINPDTIDCHCSVCGEQPEREQGESVPLYDYCPYCGAQMDGGEGHEAG